ncbi:hypothetical protein XM72_c20106 [Vibrio vulnificus]|nr:hypothetical protein XM72_c20106 [Vibrio vulnificus]
MRRFSARSTKSQSNHKHLDHAFRLEKTQAWLVFAERIDSRNELLLIATNCILMENRPNVNNLLTLPYASTANINHE